MIDLEVVAAIESLRVDVGRVATSLQAEIGKLRTEMASMREELKRHTDVRFESLRDDIRIVAEGFAAMSAKIDSL